MCKTWFLLKYLVVLKHIVELKAPSNETRNFFGWSYFILGLFHLQKTLILFCVWFDFQTKYFRFSSENILFFKSKFCLLVLYWLFLWKSKNLKKSFHFFQKRIEIRKIRLGKKLETVTITGSVNANWVFWISSER